MHSRFGANSNSNAQDFTCQYILRNMPCVICGYQLGPDENERERHIRRHLHYQAFECGLCDMRFLTEADGRAHFTRAGSKHPGRSPLIVEAGDLALDDQVALLLRQSATHRLALTAPPPSSPSPRRAPSPPRKKLKPWTPSPPPHCADSFAQLDTASERSDIEYPFYSYTNSPQAATSLQITPNRIEESDLMPSYSMATDSPHKAAYEVTTPDATRSFTAQAQSSQNYGRTPEPSLPPAFPAISETFEASEEECGSRKGVEEQRCRECGHRFPGQPDPRTLQGHILATHMRTPGWSCGNCHYASFSVYKGNVLSHFTRVHPDRPPNLIDHRKKITPVLHRLTKLYFP